MTMKEIQNEIDEIRESIESSIIDCTEDEKTYIRFCVMSDLLPDDMNEEKAQLEIYRKMIKMSLMEDKGLV